MLYLTGLHLQCFEMLVSVFDPHVCCIKLLRFDFQQTYHDPTTVTNILSFFIRIRHFTFLLDLKHNPHYYESQGVGHHCRGSSTGRVIISKRPYFCA